MKAWSNMKWIEFCSILLDKELDNHYFFQIFSLYSGWIKKKFSHTKDNSQQKPQLEIIEKKMTTYMYSYKASVKIKHSFCRPISQEMIENKKDKASSAINGIYNGDILWLFVGIVKVKIYSCSSQLFLNIHSRNL